MQAGKFAIWDCFYYTLICDSLLQCSSISTTVPCRNWGFIWVAFDNILYTMSGMLCTWMTMQWHRLGHSSSAKDCGSTESFITGKLLSSSEGQHFTSTDIYLHTAAIWDKTLSCYTLSSSLDTKISVFVTLVLCALNRSWFWRAA